MRYFILDTETTGLNSEAEAWEVAVMCCNEDGDALSSFRATCKPQVAWEEKAMQMSGLHDYELDSFQTPAEMLQKLTNYFKRAAEPNKWDNVVVIHNVAYDAPLLQHMYEKYGVETFRNYVGYSDICTMQALRLFKAAGRWEGKCSLEAVHEKLGTADTAHTAMGDVEATAELFFSILNKVKLNPVQKLIRRIKRMIKK